MNTSSRHPILILLALAAAPLAGHAQLPALETSWLGYETGKHQSSAWPWSMHVADLDGDGDADIATTTYWGSHKLGVQLNNGDGTFAPPVHYGVALDSLGFALADITGDGKLDAVVSNSGPNGEGSTVSLLVNNGNGTFAPHKQFSVGTGFAGPVGVAAGDFNGDGRNDVAVACNGYVFQGSQVALLINDGAGGFLPVQQISVGVSPYALAAGDLNADGLPDLVVARNQQKLVVLRNTGAGFAPPVNYDVLTGDGAFTLVAASIALGDVDKDGDVDVLYSGVGMVSSGLGSIALLRNDGAGNLAAAQALSTGPVEGGASALAVADVTGDGWPDILGSLYSKWTVLRGNGSGGFLPFQLFGACETPYGVEVADLDGDGDQDPVVLGRDSLEVAVYLNPGDGAFATPPLTKAVAATAVPSVGRGVSAGDVDGDGDLDLAVSYKRILVADGGVSILRNTGEGTFLPPVVYSSPLPAMHVKLADLNGDGKPDLLWADDLPPYGVKTRLNAGDGTFGALVSWSMNTCGNGEVGAIDLDDDGDLDIALCEYAGCAGGDPLNGKRVYVRMNNGDATFGPISIVVVSMFPERVHGADVNGDGHTDLLVTSNSWIDVCLGLGNGSFAAPIAAACDWAPKGFCVADLDGDGALDMATTNFGDVGSGGESTSIMFGLGNGTFEPPITLAGSYSANFGNPRDIVAGDPDGDGDLDLMAGNWGSLDVSFYRNLGGGQFATQVRYGTGANTVDLAFGDFSGDGRGDLAAMTSAGGALTFAPHLVLLRGAGAPGAWTGLGNGLAGSHGVPSLTGAGTLEGGSPLTLGLSGALENAVAQLVVGLTSLAVPFKGGVLVPAPDILVPLLTDASGTNALDATWPDGVPAGVSIYFQDWIPDPGASHGLAASNALKGTTP